MNEKVEATAAATPSPRRWILPAVIGAGALAGLLFALLLPTSWLLVPKPAAEHEHEGVAAGGKEFYACPMFCTQLDHPGDCPVCGMTMEKFVDTGAIIPLDDRKRSAVALETAPIERRFLAREVRTLGSFESDETRVKVVAAWVDGRIDKLYADFTGVPVEKGWHLFDLYSPQLYAAQKELLVARDAARREGAGDDARRMLDIAREKLRQLGLTAGQVTHIETLKEPSFTLTIPSPDTGVVTEKLAHLGMYVKQGQPVFRITDLSRLWLMVEIHERDLGWIALGQPVQVEVNAYPGRAFRGRVGFIDPQLDTKTRTVRVRVEVPNADGVLKPGMYGIATVFAELNKDARLAAPELPGAYACPMHPLQRGDNPDEECEICGMRLEHSEQAEVSEPERVWSIPRKAVLSTGRRHIVYVEWWVRIPPHEEHDADEEPTVEILQRPEYQGFEVKLGPLAAEYHVMPDGTRHKLGEYYPLISGLPTGIPDANGKAGLRIVTNGQFLIDSQMELTGKPSLMRAEGGKSVDPHAGMDMDD
jgi:Cu(I)/Ag(I) efflux system membrane fusion protein